MRVKVETALNARFNNSHQRRKVRIAIQYGFQESECWWNETAVLRLSAI